jgi:ABC-type multidrug transport system ATPase subunit
VFLSCWPVLSAEVIFDTLANEDGGYVNALTIMPTMPMSQHDFIDAVSVLCKLNLLSRHANSIIRVAFKRPCMLEQYRAQKSTLTELFKAARERKRAEEERKRAEEDRERAEKRAEEERKREIRAREVKVRKLELEARLAILQETKSEPKSMPSSSPKSEEESTRSPAL